MIPRTFPSTFAANGQQQMVVYSLPSITGLTAWIDYIPVKGVTTERATLENTYANGGYQVVDSLASLTGKQAWLDYIPVYEDASYTKPWSTDAGGYIPTSALAALLLDFTSGRLDPRITFSRTTNATVTGSNGLIQNAPMNLLTFSEQFDNAAWTKSNATVTANDTVSPDGTSTADLLVNGSGVQGQLIRNASFAANSTNTISVYLKANGVSTFQLQFSTGYVTSGAQAVFNLATGTVTSTTGGATAAITNVGNDWYRCAATCTSNTGSTTTNFFLAFTSTGNGTSGIFIWGAQLELGSTATTYNPTTVKNLLGFTENFDNAAWTKSNAFVQTNLLSFSAFNTIGTVATNNAWYETSAALDTTVNSSVAPDGTQTAALLAVNSATSFASVVQVPTGVTAGTYAYSVYCKAASTDTVCRLLLSGDAAISNFVRASFTLSGTGSASVADVSGTAVSAATPTIQAVGDGWYRCTIAGTLSAPSSARVLIYPGSPGAQTTASQTLVWGAQLVQGTSAGDYKATYAAAAAVGYTDIYGQPFAQKLVETTGTGAHLVQQTFSAGAAPVTSTYYMKAAERSIGYVRIFDNIAGAGYASYFDLSAGTVLTNASGNTATITSVGGGFWRCSVTRLMTGSSTSHLSQAGCSTADNTLSYTGDGTSGIYIFGAQLSDSASVDPYVYQPVAAPTSTAYYGPRFDYDPVTLAPKGLLIEEQRSNLLTYSEQFDNAAWVAVAAGIAANTAVSPSGATTGDSLVPSGVSATHYIYQLIALTLGASYTMTVYAKPNGYNRFMLRESTTAGYFVVFDVSTGTVVNTNSATGTITPAGNGWYRCTMTITAPLTVATVMAIINMPNNGTTYANATFTGDGTSGIYLWGAQLEAGAFATSYIPTVASQVTRAADNASIIGNNFARWYTQGQGMLFADWLASAPQLGNYRVVAELSDGGADNRIRFSDDDTIRARLEIRAGGVTSMASSVASTPARKQAGGWSSSGGAICANGGAVVEDLTVVIPTSITLMLIGSAGPANTNINSTIKRVAYYPRRLANTELQAITS